MKSKTPDFGTKEKETPSIPPERPSAPPTPVPSTHPEIIPNPPETSPPSQPEIRPEKPVK